MENNIIARLAPESKKKLKEWQKGERAKQKAIINAFSHYSTETDIISQEPTTTGGDDDIN